MKNGFSLGTVLISGMILAIISCRKTTEENTPQILVGNWAVHSKDYNSKGYGGTYTVSQQYSNIPAGYQFSRSGDLNMLLEKSKAHYSLNLSDSLLLITPDTCFFLNSCYNYFQTDPYETTPFPRRGNHTPGTLHLVYYSQDSFAVEARYVQSPGFYSDSFVVTRTGFHRE